MTENEWSVQNGKFPTFKTISLLFTNLYLYLNFIFDVVCLFVWFGLGRYGLFFATRGLIRPGPTA